MRSNIDGSVIDNSLLKAGNKLGVLAMTLSATFTMDADMPQVVCLDPGGAGRTVLLPPEAKGLFYLVVNCADAAEALTVKEDAGSTTIGTVEQGGVGLFVCSQIAAGGADTATWFDLTPGASELLFEGITAGTVTAGKALVVDANKAIGNVGTVTFADSGNIVLGTTTGSKLGSTTSEKLGLWGATPVVQPTAATQAAVATSTITTAATTTTPWGYATSTQADNLAAQVVLNRTLVNQLRADLVTIGAIKGS